MTCRMREIGTRSIPMPRTPMRSAELAPDDAGELVRHHLDTPAIRAFDHHAREWLGAGIANQHAAAAVHLLLERGDLLVEAGDRVERRLRPHGDVDENLWELAHAARERRERLARLTRDAEQRQRGEDAVAGGRVIGKQQVPGLLTAEVRAPALHLLVNVPVADLRLHDLDPLGRQRFVEPEIRHDGGDDAVALEAATPRHVASRDGERIVPVADLPEMIDGDQAIAVAVEREADRGTRRLNSLLQRLWKQRADPCV